MNDLFFFENHKRRRILQVVVEFRFFVLTLAPGVYGARLHCKSTDKLATANSDDLIAIENIFDLVGCQLIWCWLSFLNKAQTKSTVRTFSPSVDVTPLWYCKTVESAAFHLDNVIAFFWIWQFVDHLGWVFNDQLILLLLWKATNPV